MSAPGGCAVLWHIILPRISNSILVAISFAVLGIFSAFTLPYVLGPAAPEMMGPFMQRTFRDLYDPHNAITQAVITFGFCIVFGLFYVRSVAKNQKAADGCTRRRCRAGSTGPASPLRSVLTLVIIFPLLVVGTWAFTNVWRYPAVIPQEFGLRFWNQTLARADVWSAITIEPQLAVVVTAALGGHLPAGRLCLRAAGVSRPQPAVLLVPRRPCLSRSSACWSPSPASSCSST